MISFNEELKGQPLSFLFFGTENNPKNTGKMYVMHSCEHTNFGFIRMTGGVVQWDSGPGC